MIRRVKVHISKYPSGEHTAEYAPPGLAFGLAGSDYHDDKAEELLVPNRRSGNFLKMLCLILGKNLVIPH